MTDAIFYLCVALLIKLADLVGVTYEAINVWIFCVIVPGFILALLVLVFRQRTKILELEKQLVGSRAVHRPIKLRRPFLRQSAVRTWRSRRA